MYKFYDKIQDELLNFKNASALKEYAESIRDILNDGYPEDDVDFIPEVKTIAQAIGILATISIYKM